MSSSKMAHRFDSGWREGAREVMQPRKLIMKTLVPTFMRNWIWRLSRRWFVSSQRENRGWQDDDL